MLDCAKLAIYTAFSPPPSLSLSSSSPPLSPLPPSLTTEKRELLRTSVGHEHGQDLPPVVKVTHTNKLRPITFHNIADQLRIKKE